ncbi:hypothetical protein GGI43DRAFT_388302 [Trichoderma evansii]
MDSDDSSNGWPSDDYIKAQGGNSPEPANQYARISATRSQLRPAQSALSFMSYADWDPDLSYEDEPLNTIRYDINWRLLASETKVIITVTDRRTKKVVETFREIDIDWSFVAKKLQEWSHFLRDGKIVNVKVIFYYIAQSGASGRPGGGATKVQRADLSIWRDAEGNSAYDLVFMHTRCPGPPCNSGPHCWEDPTTKKHHKLITHQIKQLARAIEQGHPFKGHNNMPEEIRQEFYREDQQRSERKRKKSTSDYSNAPQINITNVMPSQSDGEHCRGPSSSKRERLYSPGFRDVAVKDYCNWHCSQVKSIDQQWQYQRARDITLEEGLDLDQLFNDINAQFFMDKDIKRGPAWRWVSDPKEFLDQYIPTGIES